MKVDFNYINIDIIFHYKLTICILILVTKLLCDPRGPPLVGRPPSACPPSDIPSH